MCVCIKKKNFFSICCQIDKDASAIFQENDMERKSNVLLLFQNLNLEMYRSMNKQIKGQLKKHPYFYHGSFRIRRPRPVSPFLEVRRSVLKNKVLAHNILNKQASRAYPTLTFHS